MVRGANDVCSSYGLTPATLGYRQCVGNEIEKRSIASHNIAYAAPDEDVAPHVSTAVDGWGFQYDAAGNLLDQDGYVIRAVP